MTDGARQTAHPTPWRHGQGRLGWRCLLLIRTGIISGMWGCASQGTLSTLSFFEVRPAPDTARLVRNAPYLKQSGRTELAVKELEETYQKEPGNQEILGALIQCYETLGRFERAQELYGEALARGGSHPGLENNRGYSWFLAGRLDKAETCFRELLARQPDNQTDRNNLGLVLCRTGREAEALALWREALDEAAAHQRLEQALAALGRGVPPGQPTCATHYLTWHGGQEKGKRSRYPTASHARFRRIPHILKSATGGLDRSHDRLRKPIPAGSPPAGQKGAGIRTLPQEPGAGNRATQADAGKRGDVGFTDHITCGHSLLVAGG